MAMPTMNVATILVQIAGVRLTTNRRRYNMPTNWFRAEAGISFF
jgi:hypothetical protein